MGNTHPRIKSNGARGGTAGRVPNPDAIATKSGGGSAGIPLAEQDRRRGLAPGSGNGGTAGSVTGQVGDADRCDDAAARTLG